MAPKIILWAEATDMAEMAMAAGTTGSTISTKEVGLVTKEEDIREVFKEAVETDSSETMAMTEALEARVEASKMVLEDSKEVECAVE